MMKNNLVVFLSLAVASSAYGFEEIGEVSEPLQPISGFEADGVGDRWVYRDNLKGEEGYQEVVERNGDASTWKDSLSECQWTMEQSFAPSTVWKSCSGSSGKQEVKLKGKIWPLTRDSEFQFKVKGRNDKGQKWRTTVKCEVEDEVRVRTVAGEFDTYKLVCSDDWNTRTRYISPKENNTVAYQRERKKRGVVADTEWVRWE